MWQRTLGILGGLGPHAHLELERRLLKAAEPVTAEQDYPPWVVASYPSTPDRTRALLEGGPSPVEEIVRGLEALAPAADFAVIACVTAHAFIDELRQRSPLPILSLVEATLEEVKLTHGNCAHVGVLATTGTLASRLFDRAACCLSPELRILSLLDLPEGKRLQEEWVMEPIYGPLRDGRRTGERLKSGAEVDPETGTPLGEPLMRAARKLTSEGASVVLTACTEIGMTLGGQPRDGTTLLDPLDVAVREALAISRGERALPSSG